MNAFAIQLKRDSPSFHLFCWLKAAPAIFVARKQRIAKPYRKSRSQKVYLFVCICWLSQCCWCLDNWLLYAHLVATLLGYISFNPCRSVRVDVGLVFVVIDTSSLLEHTIRIDRRKLSSKVLAASGRQWSFSFRSKFYNKLGHAGLAFEVIYVEVFSERWFYIIHKAWIDGVMSKLLVSKRKMVAEIKDPGNLGESSLWVKRLLVGRPSCICWSWRNSVLTFEVSFAEIASTRVCISQFCCQLLRSESSVFSRISQHAVRSW